VDADRSILLDIRDHSVVSHFFLCTDHILWFVIAQLATSVAHAILAFFKMLFTAVYNVDLSTVLRCPSWTVSQLRSRHHLLVVRISLSVYSCLDSKIPLRSQLLISTCRFGSCLLGSSNYLPIVAPPRSFLCYDSLLL
jgi:hypothetical protein